MDRESEDETSKKAEKSPKDKSTTKKKVNSDESGDSDESSESSGEATSYESSDDRETIEDDKPKRLLRRSKDAIETKSPLRAAARKPVNYNLDSDSGEENRAKKLETKPGKARLTKSIKSDDGEIYEEKEIKSLRGSKDKTETKSPLRAARKPVNYKLDSGEENEAIKKASFRERKSSKEGFNKNKNTIKESVESDESNASESEDDMKQTKRPLRSSTDAKKTKAPLRGSRRSVNNKLDSDNDDDSESIKERLSVVETKRAKGGFTTNKKSSVKSDESSEDERITLEKSPKIRSQSKITIAKIQKSAKNKLNTVGKIAAKNSKDLIDEHFEIDDDDDDDVHVKKKSKEKSQSRNEINSDNESVVSSKDDDVVEIDSINVRRTQRRAKYRPNYNESEENISKPTLRLSIKKDKSKPKQKNANKRNIESEEDSEVESKDAEKKKSLNLQKSKNMNVDEITTEEEQIEENARKRNEKNPVEKVGKRGRPRKITNNNSKDKEKVIGKKKTTNLSVNSSDSRQEIIEVEEEKQLKKNKIDVVKIGAASRQRGRPRKFVDESKASNKNRKKRQISPSVVSESESSAQATSKRSKNNIPSKLISSASENESVEVKKSTRNVAVKRTTLLTLQKPILES